MHAQRVADAIVRAEIDKLYDEEEWNGFDQEATGLTSKTIVDHYGIRDVFGTYEYPEKNGRPAQSINVAMQVVRNALTEEFKKGNLAKVRADDGTLVRVAGSVLYVDPLVNLPDGLTVETQWLLDEAKEAQAA